MGLLEKAIQNASPKAPNTSGSEEVDPLVVAVEELFDSKLDSKQKADALRSAIELAQTDKED